MVTITVKSYNYNDDTYDVEMTGHKGLLNVRSVFLALLIEWDTDEPESAIGKSVTFGHPPRKLSIELTSYDEQSESFYSDEIKDDNGFVVANIDIDLLFMLTGDEDLQSDPKSYEGRTIEITVH